MQCIVYHVHFRRHIRCFAAIEALSRTLSDHPVRVGSRFCMRRRGRLGMASPEHQHATTSHRGWNAIRLLWQAGIARDWEGKRYLEFRTPCVATITSIQSLGIYTTTVTPPIPPFHFPQFNILTPRIPLFNLTPPSPSLPTPKSPPTTNQTNQPRTQSNRWNQPTNSPPPS
jgi:hypothetical protein